MCSGKPRILVFVPTYNCESQISRVIDQFDETVQRWIDTVMVVDNRSTDKTIETAIEFGTKRFSQCHLIVWINDSNYGVGGSHKVAFRYAIEQM